MSRNWTPADVTGIIANPFYAINIAPVLAEPHPLLISEDRWVASNIKLIKDLGPDAYLRNLLSILKGNYPTAAPSSSATRQHEVRTLPVSGPE